MGTEISARLYETILTETAKTAAGVIIGAILVAAFPRFCRFLQECGGWMKKQFLHHVSKLRSIDSMFSEIPTLAEITIQKALEKNKENRDFDFLAPQNNPELESLDRAKEVDELSCWMDSAAPLAVKVITGANGSGKSHFVASFKAAIEKEPDKEKNWSICSLPEDGDEKFPVLISATRNKNGWHPRKNTLLFIDDAARYAKEILEWMRMLLQYLPSSESVNKVRIVLVDRDADFADKRNWAGGIYAGLEEAFPKALEQVFGFNAEEKANNVIIRIPLMTRRQQSKMLDDLAKPANLSLENEMKNYLKERAKSEEGFSTPKNLIALAFNNSKHQERIFDLAGAQFRKIEKRLEKKRIDRLFFCCLLTGVMLHGDMSKNAFRKFFRDECAFWKKEYEIDFAPTDKEYADLFEQCFTALCEYFGTDSINRDTLNPREHHIISGGIFLHIANPDKNKIFFRKASALQGLAERCYGATESKTILLTLMRIYQEFRHTYHGEREDHPQWLVILKFSIRSLIDGFEAYSDIVFYLENPMMHAPVMKKFKIRLLKKALSILKKEQKQNANMDVRLRIADVQLQIAETGKSSLTRQDLKEALRYAKAATDIFNPSNKNGLAPETRKKAAKAMAIQSYIQMNYEKSKTSRKKALDLASQALEIYKEVEGESFQTPEHVACLQNYGTILEKLGEKDASLDALKRAVEACKEILKNEHVSHELGLRASIAASLERGRVSSLFGNQDSEPNLPLVLADHAVTQSRELLGIDPHANGPQLAEALNQQSDRQREYEKLDETGAEQSRYALSIKSVNGAIMIYRLLDEIAPETYTPHLAGCYANLSRKQKYIGEYEKSFEAIKDSCKMRKALWEGNNETYAREFAESLALLAKEEWIRGKYTDAVAHILEARRRLEARLGNEDSALNELEPKVQEVYTFILVHQGKLTEAERIAARMAEKSKELCDKHSDAKRKYWNHYIDFLIHLSDIQRRTGQYDKACESAEAAVEFLKKFEQVGEDCRVQRSRAVRRKAKALLWKRKQGSVVGSTVDGAEEPAVKESPVQLMESVVQELDSVEKPYDYTRHNIRLIASHIDYAHALIEDNPSDSGYAAAKAELSNAVALIKSARERSLPFDDIYSEMEARCNFIEAELLFKTKSYGDAAKAVEDAIELYEKLRKENPLYFVYYSVNCYALSAAIHLERSMADDTARSFMCSALGKCNNILEENKNELKSAHSAHSVELKEQRYKERFSGLYTKMEEMEKKTNPLDILRRLASA